MEDNQPDFHSEEFERSLEAGIHQLQTIFVSFKRTSQATAVPPDHDQLQDQHSRQSAVQAAHSGEITDQHSKNLNNIQATAHQSHRETTSLKETSGVAWRRPFFSGSPTQQWFFKRPTRERSCNSWSRSSTCSTSLLVHRPDASDRQGFSRARFRWILISKTAVHPESISDKTPPFL